MAAVAALSTGLSAVAVTTESPIAAARPGLALSRAADASPVPPAGLPAPVELTTMSCSDGQVNVNTASRAALMESLQVDFPTAGRVIDGRQPYYLTLDHLGTVSGIGPGRLAAIKAAGRVCTVPQALPPATDDHACVPGDGRLDMNRPEDHFTELVGLYGRPTAQRVVERAPYAGLAHVVAEMVGGAGKGKQVKYTDRLCVTPPTVATGGRTYGWISTQGGTVTDRDDAGRRYKLSVPVDTVAAEGIWGSTGPVDASGFLAGLVGNDAQLHGSWDGVVHVGSPPDPESERLGSEWRHAVIHFPSAAQINPDDALTIQANEGITVHEGLVTAPTDSLSPFLVVAVPALMVTGLVYQPFSGWLTDLVRGFLGVGGEHPACNPDITDAIWNGVEVNTLGGALDGSPSSELVHHCVEPASDTAGLWRFTGNNGAVVPVSEQSKADITSAGVPAGNLLQTLLFGGYNYWAVQDGADRGDPYLTPGTAISVRVEGESRPASTYEPGRVRYNSDTTRTVLATIVYPLLGLTGPQPKTGVQGNYGQRVLYDALVSCAPTVLKPQPDLSLAAVGSLLGNLSSCSNNALRPDVVALLRELTGGGTIPIAAQYDRVSAIIKAAVVTTTVVDHARARDAAGTWDMTFRLPAPTPSTVSDGQASNPDATTAPPSAGFLLKSPGTIAAYYVVDRVAYHVPDGGVYDCLAGKVPTQFEVEEERKPLFFDSYADTDATCPGGVSHIANRQIGAYLKEDPSIRASEGFLIRRRDGRAFLVKDGYLVPVLTGDEYFECMARTRLTWDRVTDQELYEADFGPPGPKENHPSIVATWCTPN